MTVYALVHSVGYTDPEIALRVFADEADADRACADMEPGLEEWEGCWVEEVEVE